MSENLDLMRSILADWERGDYFSRADWVDPEIELVLVGGPDPQSLKGATEVAEGWREFLSHGRDTASRRRSTSQLGGERVLVLFHVFGRGRPADWSWASSSKDQRVCSPSAKAR